ncbi:flagellar basal body P-ring formation chaperone FlgA [Breoghania sp.]|uniref:flagellar basal body P-ring formation chaperone FlgA n=1 Tax=Breoghania sp. TaxID=2065378 RepID=UPI00262CFED7|nr:flagellar basal body P-ring formation chaperone FlgA [Breoghania sp.]MDJ0932098.1 flagellar basal body P-ring formation chaperone FlgA [Breoghania sp.]
MMRTLILTALVAALPLAGMHAGERPTLRGNVTATHDVVTIGDFFDHAGSHAERVLFRTPDLGRTGTVPAIDVLNRARAAGLVHADIAGLRQVIVHRATLTVGPDKLKEMIRAPLLERAGVDEPQDLKISYDGQLPTVTADPSAREPVKLARLAYSAPIGRFDALFTMPIQGLDLVFSVSGTAVRTVEIMTLAHRVARGATATAHDLQIFRVPRTSLRDDTVTDPDRIVGMALRRSRTSCSFLMADDFEEPLAVERRGKMIITYKVSGLTLTVQGQAMADAVTSDVIDVLNIQSQRTIQTVVTGPGRVSVQPRTGALRTS